MDIKHNHLLLSSSLPYMVTYILFLASVLPYSISIYNYYSLSHPFHPKEGYEEVDHKRNTHDHISKLYLLIYQGFNVNKMINNTIFYISNLLVNMFLFIILYRKSDLKLLIPFSISILIITVLSILPNMFYYLCYLITISNLCFTLLYYLYYYKDSDYKSTQKDSKIITSVYDPYDPETYSDTAYSQRLTHDERIVETNRRLKREKERLKLRKLRIREEA